MLLRGVFSIVICFLSLVGYTQDRNIQDSLQIFVSDNSLFTHHTIQPGQTLYSISRYYHLKAENLQMYNPDLDIYSLRIGDRLIIPIPVEYIQSIPNEDNSSIAMYYKVRPGETLFRIARIYLGWREEQLMMLNQLENTQLQSGQLLLLGYLTGQKTGSMITLEDSSLSVDELIIEKESLKENFAVRERKRKVLNQQGVAIWFKDTDVNSGLFIMHHSAPVNSIIAITNPMFNKTIYAKVVGNIPENSYPREVIAVVSPQVARELGVLDSRFFAKIRYESVLP